jgi:hypothetical protein
MTVILAALGDDHAAPSVIAAAQAVAHLFAADVELVHVREGGPAVAAEAAAQAAGLPLRLLAGERVDALSTAATREDVAALTVAARGEPDPQSQLSRTTAQLITSLSKPVIVVPAGYAATGAREIAHVLVPLDGTPATAAALEPIIEAVAAAEVEIVLIHVLVPSHLPAFGDQLGHEGRAWSAAFIARNAAAAHSSYLELRVGRPAERIAEALRESGADLVTLGWSRDLSESRAPIVGEVLATADVPVLLIPA